MQIYRFQDGVSGGKGRESALRRAARPAAGGRKAVRVGKRD